MGDVIKFRPRGSRPPNPEIEKIVDEALGAMDREAARRLRAYGRIEGSVDLLRVLAMYPMFRLTHAKKARRCLYCDHRIEPLELHFTRDGAHICQSGTCMERPPVER